MSDLATPTTGLLGHRAVVATGSGLHRWDAAGDPLDGREVTAVHADGTSLFALTDRRHLHRLDGDVIEHVASLEPDASATCVHVHGGQVWVGGDDAGLWLLRGTVLEPVHAFQEAPTRSDWHTPWGGPPAVFSMASHGRDLYVSVHVGGILRTSDGGASWSPTIDLHLDVHQVAADPSGGVWAATGERGLAHSGDRGLTWRHHTDGLHAHYLLAVAVTGDGALVAASSGHAAGDAALYRLEGGRFTRCEGGLPGDLGDVISPRHVAAAGDDAVVALPDGSVHASSDGGRSWTRIADGLADVAEVALQDPA